MRFYGKVIVIKRNGTDGAHYPLTTSCCSFGRGENCDIRIQLPAVDSKQCEIDIDDKGHAFIRNLSTTTATVINNRVMSNALTALSHGDIITIVDRSFRFEFPEQSKFYPKSPKANTPKTTKGFSSPKTGDGEKNVKIVRRSSPVSPLSPRTDNVPQSSKSPQSTKKNSASEIVPGPVASPVRRTPLIASSGSQKSPDFLFGLSPSTFYAPTVTARAIKNLTEAQQEKMSPLLSTKTPSTTTSKGSESPSLKSATPSNRQKSPGSPYSKTPANLRKSITDLRRRSEPVFETDEDSTQFINKVEDVFEPVKAGVKRKASEFALLSAKRKRVSFGPNLSPEHFDKTLPPKTPIKKGATPGRINVQERKSLLKMKSRRSKSVSPKSHTPNKKMSSPKSPVKIPIIPQDVFLEAKTAPGMLQSPEKSTKKSLQSPIGNTYRKDSAFATASNFAIGLPFSSQTKSPTSMMIVSTQQKLQSPTVQKDGVQKSPLSKSGKPATPKRSSSAHERPVTLKSGKSASIKRSSSVHDLPATPKSTKSVTPKKSSPAHESPATPKSGKPASPKRSSPAHELLATPKSGKSASPKRSSSVHELPGIPKSGKSASPKRSSSVHESPGTPKSGKSATPKRSSSAYEPATPKSGRSATPKRSSSAYELPETPKSGKSTTPKRSSSVHERPITPKSGKSTTPKRSSSAHESPATPKSGKSTAPKKSSPAHESPETPKSGKSATPKRSSSAHESPAIPKSGKSKTPKRSSSAHESPATPKSGKSATPKRSSSSHELSATPKSGKFATLKSSSPTYELPATPKSGKIATLNSLKISATTKSNSTHLKTSPRTAGLKSTKEVSGTPKMTKQIYSKQKWAHTVEISPAGLRRIMKTPKEKGLNISVSPTGIKNLVKTPKIKRIDQTVNSPSGIKRLLKTPKQKQILETTLTGIKELLKTPKPHPTVNFLGISAALSSPKQDVTSPNINNSNVTPVAKYLIKPVDTPRPIFSNKRGRSPKIFFDEIQSSKSVTLKKYGTPRSPASDSKASPLLITSHSGKRSVGRPPSATKLIKAINSDAGKIISPPQDFNKVVALRAIHGHSMTPKIASKTVGTPKSGKQVLKSAKKTPYKKTWSDIVKSGIQKPVATKFFPANAKVAVARKKSPVIKTFPNVPKTPRTIARALAPTTGHADSPATIIVGKKVLGRKQTPKPLPRKGRKQSLNKASRKSAGNTSFSGLAEMFTEQPETVLNESSLYADIPDTPNGPNEMFVSPLSSQKQSRSGFRKSTNLIGVKELFTKKKARESDFTGVKELFTSSNSTIRVSPFGLKRLIKTPKKLIKDVSPIGLGRLLATPKTKVLASPTGIDQLFKTPVITKISSPKVGKSTSKQSQKTTELKSNKAGTRKRKAEDTVQKPLPKKIRLSDTHENAVADVSVTASNINLKSSPANTRRGLKQLQVIDPVAVQTAFILDKKKTPSPKASRGRPSKKQNIEAPSIPKKASVTYLNISSSPAKSAGRDNTKPSPKATRGRPSKKQNTEVTSVQDKEISINDSKRSLPTPKSAGRGRPQKSLTIELISSDKAVEDVGRKSSQATRQKKKGKESHAPAKKTGQVNVQVTDFPSASLKNGDEDKKAVSSPVKAVGRSKQSKVKKAAPQMEVSLPIVSPAKVSKRGKQAQVQAPVNIIEAISSPAKTVGRTRRGKIQKVKSPQIKISSPKIVSPAKTVRLGKQGQVYIPVDAVKAILSPAKVVKGNLQTVRSPLNKITLTVVSPAKIVGRSKRGKEPLVKSPFSSVKSSAKTAGRGRRGQVQMKSLHIKISPLVAVAPPVKKNSIGQDKVVALKAAPSPAKIVSLGKARGRNRKENVQPHNKVNASVEQTVSEAVLSPPKTKVRGRKGKAEVIKSPQNKVKHSPVKKSSQEKPIEVNVQDTTVQNENSKVSQSPIKGAAKGKKNQAKIAETTPERSSKAGRGRHAQKLKSPLTKVVSSSDKTVASPIKAGKGKHKIEIAQATASPLKSTSPGKKIKKDASTEVATLTTEKNFVSPPKAAGQRKHVAFKNTPVTAAKISPGSKDRVSLVESVLSPKSRGRPAKGKSIKSPVTIIPNAVDIKTTHSPVKTGGPKSISKTKNAKRDEHLLSPVKSQGIRRGKAKTMFIVDEPVSSTPVANKQKAGKRKAETTAIPTPEKKLKVDSAVENSPPKKQTRRGKKAQVSPLKVLSPVKVSKSVGAKPKKDDAPKAVVKKTPVKGKRNQLESVQASPATKRQGRAKASAASPKSISVTSKKISKGSKFSASKTVTPKKSQRQRK